MKTSIATLLMLLLGTVSCTKEISPFPEVEKTFSFKAAEMVVEVTENTSSFTVIGTTNKKSFRIMPLFIEEDATTAIDGVQYIKRYDYQFDFKNSNESSVKITIFPENINKEVQVAFAIDKEYLRKGGIGRIVVKLTPKK